MQLKLKFTNILVGRQQPACFVFLFFFLVGSTSARETIGDFSLTVSLRFRKKAKNTSVLCH